EWSFGLGLGLGLGLGPDKSCPWMARPPNLRIARQVSGHTLHRPPASASLGRKGVPYNTNTAAAYPAPSARQACFNTTTSHLIFPLDAPILVEAWSLGNRGEGRLTLSRS
ncbi:hypothetical protein E4U46_001248, partial [Claviceps purpurea]